MYRIILFILSLLFCSNAYSHTPPIVSAFMHVENGINTLPACLKSIKGLVDKIVIIHEDKPNDESIKYIKKWCTEDHQCIHKAYPSHDPRQYNFQNALANYYNLFEPEEWILKIDANQIYIRPYLREFIQKIKKTGTDGDLFTATGYHTFEHRNQLFCLKEDKFTGTNEDVFAIKRKNLLEYKQIKSQEIPKINDTNRIHNSTPIFFHFMKSLTFFESKESDQQKYSEEQMDKLTNDEIQIFEKYIRPLFDNKSVYKNLEVTTKKYN